jgi:CRISPR-associated protein Cas8a1/Csx13
VKLNLRLNAPGMTSLHKAGLAGLYMTLQAFEETNEHIEGLSWSLENKNVLLEWDDDRLKSTFEKFIDRSFWIDEEGFIRLKGLEINGFPKPDKKYQLYNALLNSFLQFGPHRPTDTKRDLFYDIGDHPFWIRDFAPIKTFRHRQAMSDFIDENGRFRESVDATGWLYPGGGQRHVVYKDTKLNESPELALALLFAPVGVVYYSIKSYAKGRKARLAMVVPHIEDLQAYSDTRQIFADFGVQDLTASSASDAALRMMVTLKANKTANELAREFDGGVICRVVTFGIVSWNEKQKSRTYARSVMSGELHGFSNYQIAHAIFENRWQRITAKYDRRGNEVEPERHFVTTFSAREFIAENIALGKSWYEDLAQYLANRDSRAQLRYERKELHLMVQAATFDNENERLFIEVCQESWRRRLGKLGQRAVLEKTSFSVLANKEAEKLRTSLARCKNAAALRETVVDFWSRGGANRLLQGKGLVSLLPIFSDWKRARDLALLALISYQPRTEQEAALLAEIEDEGEEEHE